MTDEQVNALRSTISTSAFLIFLAIFMHGCFWGGAL